jgi:hypothetical protein
MAWPRVVRVRLGGNAYPILMCSGSASKWPLVRAPHPASPFPFSTNGPAGSACNPSRETGGSLSVARSIDRAEWTTMLSYRQKIDRFLTREQAARAAKFFATGRLLDGQSRRGRDLGETARRAGLDWRCAGREAGAAAGPQISLAARGEGGASRVGVVPRHDVRVSRHGLEAAGNNPTPCRTLPSRGAGAAARFLAGRSRNFRGPSPILDPPSSVGHGPLDHNEWCISCFWPLVCRALPRN